MRLHIGCSIIAALTAASPLSVQTPEPGPGIYRFRPDAPLPVPLAGPRWWKSQCDLVREPYAVTAGAVRYYMAVVALFDNPTRARHLFSNRDGRNGVAFRYVATAGPAGVGAPPNARYVVRLELRWEEPCSGLCGLQYRADRLVYFDAAGRVLEISGDGRLIVVTG